MRRPRSVDALVTSPIRTEPNTTHYEWAGTTLKRLVGARQAISETWAFFSGPQKPARIAGGRGLTMAGLVTARPDVLGPAGADPDNHGQKYFFVKFLDPSDFPPFAYVGFRPDAVGAARRRLEAARGRRFATDEEWTGAFREHLADLLWQDRQAVERLAALLRASIRSSTAFARWKAAYKRWAIAQSQAGWTGAMTPDLKPFVPAASRAEAQAALRRQRELRRSLVSLLHRIDFAEGQAILVETPTLHAIAGLSLQVHPKAPGNFHPKDELWIYKAVPLPGGRASWLLVEPQRTFDKTESGGDFFTPYAWHRGRGSGVLGFRKPISRAYLETFVALLDLRPRPRAYYLRTAQPLTGPAGAARSQARWFRVVEEPGWPYFLARELRFEGPGESTLPLAHHSFIELHATSGTIEVTLTDRHGQRAQVTVSPKDPVFLPASLPHDTITYRASAPACLLFFSRHPRPASTSAGGAGSRRSAAP